MSINAKSQRRTRHRRAQVASVAAAAAAAAAASLGVEPQAEAPHSALVAPRARAARCVGAFAAAPAQHARTQRHRSVLLPRARGIRPKALCVFELIASAARARQGARRRSAPVDGKWRECCELICRPRAQHASVGRCAGTSWPDLGVRAQLLRSARASRRAAKGPRAAAQVDGKWRDGWEPIRSPTRLEPAAAGRSVGTARVKKR